LIRILLCVLTPSRNSKDDEFVSSILSKSALLWTVNAESIRRGTNSIRNDWGKKEWLSLAQRLNERMKVKKQKLQDSNRSRSER
jgi:hypothetical protein